MIEVLPALSADQCNMNRQQSKTWCGKYPLYAEFAALIACLADWKLAVRPGIPEASRIVHAARFRFETELTPACLAAEERRYWVSLSKYPSLAVGQFPKLAVSPIPH